MKSMAGRTMASAQKVQRKQSRIQRRHPDAHETQADRAGRAFTAGATQRVAGLTPAEAAGWRVPGSVGNPLHAPLREQLEQAFDADLAGVRVHADRLAAQAATGFGAVAFASGRHIYFGEGCYDPQSDPGRRLVAHEVAHVLQQTGRAGSGGRLVAADATGHGAVQCEDDPNADSWVGFLADETLSLKALNKRHGDAPGADDSLRGLIGLVNAESAGKLPHAQDSPIGKRLVQIANDGGFEVTDTAGAAQTMTLTTASGGYLVDALKVCGQEQHFEAAATLLDADATFGMRSTFGPRTAFRKYLQDMRGEDWVAKALQHPTFARFWPGVFLNVFEQYVFNPGRPRQSLYGFKDARDEALKNIDGNTEELIPGDRLVLAFELLDTFDRRRLAMMETLDGVLEKRGIDLTRPVQRLKATNVLADWLQGQLKSASSQAWRGAIERMRKTAVDAAGYWARVQELVSTTFDAVDVLGGDVTAGVSGKMKHVALTGARFEPLKKLLQGLAQPGGLYAVNAAGAVADLPDPPGYEMRLLELARALGVAPTNPAGNQLLVLQTDLLAQYHGSNGLDSELALATGFAIWWLLEFQPALMSYQAAKDSDARRGFTDRRMAHRVETAAQVLRFAQAVGWPDVLADAARVVRGDDKPGSYLLVRGSWHIDEGAELSQMAQDFGSRPLFQQYPFTADHVAGFFHADMLRQMADAVAAQVERVYADPKARLKVEEVNRVIRAAGRPWRVLPEGPLLILQPLQVKPLDGGRKNPDMPSAFSLIQASLKSLDDFKQIATLKQLGNPYYYTAQRETPTPMFAWLFPDIAALIRHLRPVAPFDSLVPDGDKLDDESWMIAVVKAMGSGQIKAALGKHVADYETAEQAGLEGVLREFTTVLRRERRETVAGWLKRYAGDRTVVNFELPQRSVDTIQWFRVEARPEVDATAQQALLVLSLGSELAAAFPKVRHAARIPPLFHYTLTEAVKFADQELAKADSGDATYRAALKPLLFRKPYDPADAQGSKPKQQMPDEEFSQFLAHRDQLQALADRLEAAHR
ncbi:MAG: hypothetical protein JWQ33_558, partial [Ramlibacter sp.]|nr:hypothetical protein [Ramlibacter sp.]